MKKILSLILAIIVILVCLVGCSKKIIPNNVNSFTDYNGVYITVESVDDTGEYPKFKVEWNNETEYKVYCKNEYYIERQIEGEWLSTSIAMVSFTDKEKTLQPRGKMEETYTTEYFNVSEKGTYRIRVEFSVQDNEEMAQSGTSWVVFDVK